MLLVGSTHSSCPGDCFSAFVNVTGSPAKNAMSCVLFLRHCNYHSEYDLCLSLLVTLGSKALSCDHTSVYLPPAGLQYQGLGHTLKKTSEMGSVTTSLTELLGMAFSGSTSEFVTRELSARTSSQSAFCQAALDAIILWFTFVHVGFTPLFLCLKLDFSRACVYNSSRGNKKCLVMFDLLEVP